MAGISFAYMTSQEGGSMKKFFLLFCLAMAICYSALSRAEVTRTILPVPAESVEFNEEDGVFTVTGTLPNPCTSNPRITLAPTEQDGVLSLGVAAEYKGAFCIQILGKRYSRTASVTDVKRELINLGLDPNGTYTIVTSEGQGIVEINFADVQLFSTVGALELPSVFPAGSNGLNFVPVDNGSIFTAEVNPN